MEEKVVVGRNLLRGLSFSSVFITSLVLLILTHFHSTAGAKTSGQTVGDIITKRQAFGMTDFILVFQIISACQALVQQGKYQFKVSAVLLS
jgi:hypothetical protein